MAANRRVAERESAEATPVPMEEGLVADRAELAKRQRKRRGYCLDLAQSQWYEGDVEMTPGAGTFVMKYDDYPVERGVPVERIVADGDKVFVTWEEPSQVEDVRLPQPALLKLLTLGRVCAGKHLQGGDRCAGWPTWRREGGHSHDQPGAGGRRLAR